MQSVMDICPYGHMDNLLWAYVHNRLHCIIDHDSYKLAIHQKLRKFKFQLKKLISQTPFNYIQQHPNERFVNLRRYIKEQPEFVKNLSTKQFTDNELNVLGLGLNVCPTTREFNCLCFIESLRETTNKAFPFEVGGNEVVRKYIANDINIQTFVNLKPNSTKRTRNSENIITELCKIHKDDLIVIKKLDNSNEVVIWSTPDYKKEALRQLNSNSYTKIDEESLATDNRHSKKNPSKFTKTLQCVDSYLPDSDTFEKNRTLKLLDKVQSHGTLDVESLYTSIPLDEDINVLGEYLIRKCSWACNRVSNIITMLHCTLKNNIFQFDNEVYRHTIGCTMRTSVVPVFAYLYVAAIEEKIITSCTKQPKHFLRCIDDIWLM
ncbi:hypothetical protein GJ496_007414 [Pomphorhynchus laevis]|nr:hypothetical protein GJ496_007414 [Pomphorhynchus laevis]